MVGEDTATPSNRVSTIFSTKFIMPEFLWGSAFKLSAVSAYAIIDVANCVGVEIDGIALASAWTPGITAIFSVPVYCNMIISGDLTTLFANCVAAVSPAVNQFMSVGNFQTVLHNKQGFGYPWSGQLAYVATGSATVGQVMLLNGSPSAGTTTETPMGIIMHAATSGTWFPAATSGLVTAKTTGSITQWLPLRTAAAGVGVTTGSNAVFGVAGFNVGTDLWLTYLRGL
jgi:hypothetical protein